MPPLRLAFAKHEADAAHGVDEPDRLLQIDLPAQARDVYVDDVVERRRARGLFPDVAGQRLPRHHLSLMPEQVLEQLEFADGQLDRFVAAGDLAGEQIDLEIADRESGRVRDPAAAHQRADACHQLRERKRLDEIVVGTAVEAGHPILQRIARGEHEHGRLEAARAQRAQDLEAVPARQRQIEQDRVERFGVDAEERRFASPLDDDVVLLALKALAQGVGDFLFVLDYENAHGCTASPIAQGGGRADYTAYNRSPCPTTPASNRR